MYRCTNQDILQLLEIVVGLVYYHDVYLHEYEFISNLFYRDYFYGGIC